MSVKILDLSKELLPYTPGCPGPLARRELVRSAQRFCRDTQIAVVEVNGVVLLASSGEVDLSIYSDIGMQPLKVATVSVDGRPMRQVTERAIASQYGAPLEVKTGAASRYFYMLGEATFRVYPVTDQQQVLALRLVQLPTDNATSLPDSLGGEWREAIVGGALQRVCTIPGQPYTSVDHAAMGASWYRTGVNLAKIEVNRSHGSLVSVVMRPFF